MKVYLAYVSGLKEKEVEGRERVHSQAEAGQVYMECASPDQIYGCVRLGLRKICRGLSSSVPNKL